MYKYLFGPVPSRRLGMSLGVDLVPRKVCSLDCVYCEVGKTTMLSLERKEYVLFDKVTEELRHFFSNNTDPDFITFSGSGEPTLNSRLGDVIRFIKQIRPDMPVAVLTNGTLLWDKDVRMELQPADIVLPSLDAATVNTFERINRPAAGLNIDTYIQGLVDFRQEYSGKIYLEVFILPGYNNNRTDLEKLRDAILKIGPDSVQLNTLDRPGVVKDLAPALREELEAIVKTWNIKNVEIIASATERKNVQSYRKDAEDMIMAMISRRPCTADDLCKSMGMGISEINKYLGVLESDNKITAVRQERGVFYRPV